MIPNEKEILVTRASMPSYEEFIEEIKPIWETAWMTNMGEFHDRLKDQLKDYLKAENLLLFVNGHMALEMALQAMNLTGEVITTPFSFASTTHAIVRNNLTPVFCDIREDDYTIDADQIEALITDKTTAILPVHVYGNVCDVEKIESIAKKHNLKVIYDAAHAFGVEVNHRGIGTFGDASMFSFHATKVYNTIEGGAVTFKEPALEILLNYLKNFGITGKESVEYIGGNAKMNEFQAAMGICNLRHVEENIEKRRIASQRYRDHLEGIAGIRLSPVKQGIRNNYAYFPVSFEGFVLTRDQVYDLLASHHIFARKYFYPLITDFDCYRERFSGLKLPSAKRAADSVLTLPLYADLPLEDIDRICKIIINAAQEGTQSV
ncbi:DegT/DnrJ/EryC1/StrS family aminotransferase [Clostridium boliviensis]|uniref:DegT/DnrJ/EryC1/StrS family aminotransferase n=1 Tax=Clostridium boliviensis TaxID=318465 RepID=A0ABU4GQ29_9CLOT|nr:DegT/DnrJ/EryC1/StrS family aminotransferase [Clostridium boliviensis]MDW2799734.1 DegT/DnrJ/EryC1/StrS family aminotransferase [Clostridium boliviensis]